MRMFLCSGVSRGAAARNRGLRGRAGRVYDFLKDESERISFNSNYCASVPPSLRPIGAHAYKVKMPGETLEIGRATPLINIFISFTNRNTFEHMPLLYETTYYRVFVATLTPPKMENLWLMRLETSWLHFQERKRPNTIARHPRVPANVVVTHLRP